MAIRMALDWKLYRSSEVTPTSTGEAIELANHTRTWRACVLLDGSSAVKFGRAPTLQRTGSSVQARDARDAQTGFEIRIFNLVNNFLQLAKIGSAVSR
jgi:hypothetical protein